MCISPIKIPNPNRGYNMPYKDCISQYIFVPCGQCSECIYHRSTSLVQRVLMESKISYLYFCTLTYNNENIPKITTSQGFEHTFVDWSHFQKMMKRVRKSDPIGRSFKYFAVSERGTKKHRPHIHFILAVEKLSSDDIYTPHTLEMKLFPVFLNEWSKNIGTNRKPIYIPLCTYKEKFSRGKLFRNYDFQYLANDSIDRPSNVAYYVTKYMLKPSKFERYLYSELFSNHSLEEANEVWKLIHSKSCKSLNFGWSPYPWDGIQPYLKDCVKRSITNSMDSPQFFSPFDGSSMPLCRFYKAKEEVFSMDDFKYFFAKLHPDGDPTFFPDDLRSAKVINGSDKLDFLIDSSFTADLFDIIDF